MLKALLGVLVLVGASASAAWWYQKESVAELPELRTVSVERGDVQFTIDATGTVEPEEVVDVGAQVAGKIQNLGIDPRDAKRVIDYGSPVNVGTVLARIDDSIYQSEVEQAQAQVESAQAASESTAAGVQEAQANVQRAEKDLLQMRAKLFQAERDWVRTQGLWKASPGAISESDYDLARSTYESADATVGVGTAAIAQATALLANSKASVAKSRADLLNAQANLRRTQTNLGYCTIKSPVEGVIIDRRINVGQTVVSSLNSPSLFLIAKDLKKMQVWASVNEADIGHITSGQSVRFTVDAFPREVFRGVVAPDQPRLNASMNQNVVTYTVVVNTDNSKGRLLPYLTADLQFEVAKHSQVLFVPNAALRWRPTPERLAASGLSASAIEPPAKDVDKAVDADGMAAGDGTVWLVEGARVKPVKVRTGLSDGTRTEVSAPELSEGAVVAIAEQYTATADPAADPFSPKVFSGGGKRQQQ